MVTNCTVLVVITIIVVQQNRAPVVPGIRIVGDGGGTQLRRSRHNARADVSMSVDLDADCANV